MPWPGRSTSPPTSSSPRREPSTAKASGSPPAIASIPRPGRTPISSQADGILVRRRAARTAIPSVAGATRTEPINVYGATKLAQEHILKTWGAALGSAVSILRFQNVYGVGQSLTNPYTGVLSLSRKWPCAARPFPFTRTGRSSEISSTSRTSSTRCGLPSDPTHHKSIARCRLWNRHHDSRDRDGLATRAGAPEPVVTGAFRDGDVRAASCDISATRKDLGYEPRWDLAAGLDALVDWVSSQLSHQEAS